jgi:transcriptional regulator
MPPTIYYTAVHCYGTLTFQNNPELLESLNDLVSRNEAKVPDGWKITEVPDEAILRRLNSILGFELQIERIEAKFKLGQDEPKRDALAVAERLLHSESAGDRALGAMVYKYNEARDS